MEFCKPVHACRGAGLVFPAGHIVRLFPEHIVGGYVYQCAVIVFDGIRKIADGCRIKCLGKGGVLLGFVDIGVSGTVYYDSDLIVSDHASDRCRIGDVKLCHIREYVIVLGASLETIAEAIAELAVGSCH